MNFLERVESDSNLKAARDTMDKFIRYSQSTGTRFDDFQYRVLAENVKHTYVRALKKVTHDS